MSIVDGKPVRKRDTYMKTFTIDTDNNITVHASRKAARETGAGVFATEEQFADLIGPDNKCLAQPQLPCWPKTALTSSGQPTSVTIRPQAGNTDDSFRIQQAIYTAAGRVLFKAGTYNLKRPVCLQSYLTYVGEGGGGDLKHGSILQGAPGQAIFTFDQNLDSVTISGLTFQGLGTKGLAAASGKWLYNSTIRDNYFRYVSRRKHLCSHAIN